MDGQCFMMVTASTSPTILSKVTRRRMDGMIRQNVSGPSANIRADTHLQANITVEIRSRDVFCRQWLPMAVSFWKIPSNHPGHTIPSHYPWIWCSCFWGLFLSSTLKYQQTYYRSFLYEIPWFFLPSQLLHWECVLNEWKSHTNLTHPVKVF